MKKLVATSIILIMKIHLLYSQNMDSIRAKKFIEFCSYVKKVDSLHLNNQYITNNYVDISYITPDSDYRRLNYRLVWLKKFVIGLQNSLKDQNLEGLKIIPISKITNNNTDLINGLKRFDGNIYGLYNLLNSSTEPIFYLYYEPKAEKVASWVLINQGGYYYFFKLNLIGNYK